MNFIGNDVIHWVRLIILLLLLGSAQPVVGQESAFTYQGFLKDNGNPATGPYDMQFKLFDTASIGTGAQQGPTFIEPIVDVQSGAFTVRLDFGAQVFTGGVRFLEIGVRPSGSSDPYTLLAPRQQILPTPYSMRSSAAATADGLSVACMNCVTTGNIADGAVTAAKVAPNAVSENNLAPGSVGTDKLADNSVTAPKVAPQQVVKSIAGLKDDVGIAAGAGISISQSNNSLMITATPVASPSQVLTHLRLSIPGVTGDNPDGTIEAYTYSSGVSLSGAPNFRPSFTPLTIQKGIDRASATLQDHLVRGLNFQSLELQVYTVDPVTQAETLSYKVRLTNVFVTRHNPVFSTPLNVGSAREEVAFAYDIIHWDYLTGGVTVTACWNLKTNNSSPCP